VCSIHALPTPRGIIYYFRINFHKDESHVAVLDNNEEVVEEYAGAKAALNATSNDQTVYDTLWEHFDVVVADTNTNQIHPLC